MSIQRSRALSCSQTQSLSRHMRIHRCTLIFALCSILSVARTLSAQPFFIDDVTRGLRFEPPLLSIAESPSAPNTLYVGTQNGRLYVSNDGGESWLENTVRVPRNTFLGSIHRHQNVNFEPLPLCMEAYSLRLVRCLAFKTQ